MGQFEKTFRMKELSADIGLRGAIDEKCVFEVNAVEGFVLPKTVVQSVLVPFTTDDGEEGTDIALEFGTHYLANGTFNFPAPKSSTGESMVPDFIPERLFKFLRA